MTIEFKCTTGQVEQRRARRSAVALDGAVRERGRSAQSARLTEISRSGCRIAGYWLVAPGTPVWVRIPGLENLAGHVAWSDEGGGGVAFETPLHPAVAARYEAPGDDVVIPFPETSFPHARATLLSRREQIAQGVVETERSPLQSRKPPRGSGIAAMISRQVTRSIDQRHERRFTDVIPGSDGAVRLAGAAACVRNVSASGLKLEAATDARIGAQVEVAFDGFDAYDGRVVWRRGDETGVSLPPKSIDIVGD